MRTLPRAAVCAAALFALLAAGCADKKDQPAEGRVRPKGRLLENGVPVQVNTDGMPPGDVGLRVTFIPLAGPDVGTSIEAVIFEAREGLFELCGPDGKGIAPGKYRVAVAIGPTGGQDRLKGKFSPEKSKIEVEVKEGEELVIDLAKYK